MAKYIVRFGVALNRCSDIIDIRAKFLFKEHLWAEIVQVMSCYPSSLKDSQATAQRAGSLIKHASIFEHAKRKK